MNCKSKSKSSFELAVEINEEVKAFEEMNKKEIIRLRYVRFYCTLILKDMLMDQPLDAIA